MNLLVSLELRWFFDGQLPVGLDKWFSDLLPGGLVSPVDKRDDIYLFQPSVEHIGIKLRDGRLEIKWRELARPYKGPHGAAGQVERWLKWNWADSEGPGPDDIASFGVPRGPWIGIAKERRQRKYGWEKDKWIPVPASGTFEQGVVVEITALKMNGRPYSTVLVETFAPNLEAQQQLLDTAVEYLWQDFPKPLPGTESSYGYPHWLWRFGQS